MKILIINYFYPPVVNAHSYRWHEITKEWIRKGHKVDIITSALLEHESDKKPNIMRVGWKKESNSIMNSIGENKSDRSSSSKLISTIKKIYRRFYWPDAWWFWIPSVFMAIFTKRKEEYNLIVSYYPCMASVLAGVYYKIMNKDTRFIIDYGDPFSVSNTMQPNNYKLYSWLNSTLEQFIFKYADVVSFTNNRTLDLYLKKYKSNKFTVIPHLTNIEESYVSENLSGVQERFQIVYMGSFHKGIREPYELFSIISDVNKKFPLELIIYGPDNGFKLKEYESDCIKYFGMISKDSLPSILKRAGAIVNVNNINCCMTPSKIVEAISTGIPIINIKNKVNDDYISEYESFGFAISIDNNENHNENVNSLISFLSKIKDCNRAPIEIVRDILRDNDISIISDIYIKNAFKNKE
ncbi:hypothetical protein [Yersinia ruckeri]|uniref:hypothetical protein n=1 Tax=Yersinia ruckeri TaxID=29486 RepID=UPI002238AAD8|nr:hypothetical protein [Yersinia ruckeri]MCW6625056.1 hypothetical protein [Yersinia ruckeri]